MISFSTYNVVAAAKSNCNKLNMECSLAPSVLPPGVFVCFLQTRGDEGTTCTTKQLLLDRTDLKGNFLFPF